MSGSGLRSGQLADAAGVNLQTVRYYERRGLLPSPQRSPGGHRLYPADTGTCSRGRSEQEGREVVTLRSDA